MSKNPRVPRPSGNGTSTTTRMRLLALVALLIAVVGLCVLIAVPFLPAITWGVALSIIAWPLHRWIDRRVKYPRIAAALSTAIVVSAIVASGLFVAYQLAAETNSATDQLRDSTADRGIRKTLDEVPGVNRVVEWMDRVGVDVEAEIRKLVVGGTSSVVSLAQGSLARAIQFLVAVFILYYVFLDRTELLDGVRDLLPLARSESDAVLAEAADSVHANLYATLVTSAIDTVCFGFLFWALGLPAPVLWAAVMFVLSLLPIVGAAFVWFPAAVYLALSGRLLAAGILLGWGLASFVLVSNYLYVRLAGGKMRMHPILAMIAFLGGMAVFGMSGMILGPAIVAVASAFVTVWKKRVRRNGTPSSPVTSDNGRSAIAETNAAV